MKVVQCGLKLTYPIANDDADIILAHIPNSTRRFVRMFEGKSCGVMLNTPGKNDKYTNFKALKSLKTFNYYIKGNVKYTRKKNPKCTTFNIVNIPLGRNHSRIGFPK